MPRPLLWIYATVVILYATEGFFVTVFGPYLETLGVPYSVIGFLISSFAVMMLVSRLPAGLFYRPDTVHSALSVILAVIGVATFLYPYASSFLPLATLRIVQGFFFGAATTLNMAMFFDARPESVSRSRAMGWFAAALAAGKLLGRLVGGIMADAFGFHTSFSVAALIPMLGIAFLYAGARASATDRDGSRRQTSVAGTKPGESTSAPRSEEKRAPKSPPAQQAGLRERLHILSDPLLLLCTLMAFSLNFLHQMFDNFFPLYVLGVGMTLTAAGLFGAAANFAGIFSRLMTGELGRIISPRHLATTGLVLSAIVIVLVPSIENTLLLTAFVMVLALGRAITTVSAATEVMRSPHTQGEKSGLASAMFNAGKDLGNILGPFTGGVIAAHVGVAGMFRILPAVLIVFYLAALVWAQSRIAKSTHLADGAETHVSTDMTAGAGTEGPGPHGPGHRSPA